MCADERFAAYEAIQRFLAQAKRPVAFEPGEDPMPLVPGSFEIRTDGNRLVFQIWTVDRNLVRRVTGIETESPSQLSLTVERFGKRAGTLQILDAGRPQAAAKTRRAGRQAFREVLRRCLLRQFPGWRVAELSCEPDLEHSLSPAYPRAFLKKGAAGWAAIGAATSSDADHALTSGLIWLDYLRRREAKTVVEGLAIFIPEGSERTTCHRIRHLDSRTASWAAFVHSDGWEQRVDIADSGNIDTDLHDLAAPIILPEWVRTLGDIAGVEAIETGGEISYRVRGLQFAKWNGTELRFGIDNRRRISESRRGDVEALARELVRSRDAAIADRRSPLFSLAPERWLESQLRANLPALDASLLPSPVYEQAPTFSAGERGVIDLLAVDRTGRLTVIEIKASEDLNLPLQALDYWARVKWHLERDEFTKKGYFRGVALSRRPPRLLLVAPALHFHPTTETLLRFFSSDVEVERIGLAASWRSGVKVMFRARGADGVQSEHEDEERDEADAGADAGPGCAGAPEPW